MDEPTQPVGGCRYYATTGCLLALAAVLLVIFFVAAAGTGFAWLVNAVWSFIAG